MDITQIDSNFLIGSQISSEGLVWRSALDAPFGIHGLAVHREGVFLRLPEALLPDVSEGVRYLAANTAGGRVRFQTDSARIAVRVLPLNEGMMPHMPLTGSVGADVSINNLSVNTLRPMNDKGDWYEGECTNECGFAQVDIGLPLYNGVKHMLIGLSEGARVEPPREYLIKRPIVFYGSSITQGGCASKPGNAYEGFLSRWLDADYINLGFSGSAKGEANIAEYISTLPMSAFVYDYDHNAPSAEHLKHTHAPFFDIIRRAQPLLPIIFVTKPDCLRNRADAFKRKQVIYETYTRAKLAGDTRVQFLDGHELFGDADFDACTMDGTHPNDLGFYRMARAMLPYLKRALSQ